MTTWNKTDHASGESTFQCYECHVNCFFHLNSWESPSPLKVRCCSGWKLPFCADSSLLHQNHDLNNFKRNQATRLSWVLKGTFSQHPLFCILWMPGPREGPGSASTPVWVSCPSGPRSSFWSRSLTQNGMSANSPIIESSSTRNFIPATANRQNPHLVQIPLTNW